MLFRRCYECGYKMRYSGKVCPLCGASVSVWLTLVQLILLAVILAGISLIMRPRCLEWMIARMAARASSATAPLPADKVSAIGEQIKNRQVARFVGEQKVSTGMPQVKKINERSD